jgi:hypothetical protein
LTYFFQAAAELFNMGGSTSTSVYGTVASNVHPFSVWLSVNNAYYSDSKSNKIYKLNGGEGLIGSTPELFAGTTSAGYDEAGTPALSASFNRPHGIFGDSNFLYVCDTINFAVRAISFTDDHPVSVIGKKHFHLYFYYFFSFP